MLTGRFEAIPGEDSDITPSTWQTMSNSFKSSYLYPGMILPQSKEDRKDFEDKILAMQKIASAGDQGLLQKSANWLAGFGGGVVNPLSIGAGGVAGMITNRAVSGAGGLIGKYLPAEWGGFSVAATAVAQKRIGTIIGENVPDFVRNATLGGMTTGAISGFTAGTGFSLPQEIAETYDKSQDGFNWWGGVKSSVADGGIGLGLMSVPYLAGTLWGKMFKSAGEALSHAKMPLPHEAKAPEGVEPKHPVLSQIDEALSNGKIDSESANWFRDYLTGKDTNKNLTERAISLLIKDGHPVDASTKRVLFQIFKPEEIDNLQLSLADKLAANIPENMKSLFHDFIINTKLDDIRGNTKMLDGLQGVVQFIKKRLELKPEELINANKILRRFLPENTKEENPFTQHKVYQAAKANKSIGVINPDHVNALLKHDKKMKNLENKIANYEKEFKRTNKTKYKKLKHKLTNKLIELEKTKPRLLTHREEMDYLRNELMPSGIVKDNFKTTNAYHRLLDLTRVRSDARRLMHELHINHEYEMHEHYANFLDALTKVMRSSVGKLANNDNLINYMKERLIRKNPEFSNLEKIDIEMDKKLENIKEKELDSESENEQDNNKKNNDYIKHYEYQMKDAPDDILKEFDSIKNQLKEFRENPNVFKNLIKCVQGTINV